MNISLRILALALIALPVGCIRARRAARQCRERQAAVRHESLLRLPRLCRPGQPRRSARRATDAVPGLRRPAARAARDHAALQGGDPDRPGSRRHRGLSGERAPVAGPQIHPVAAELDAGLQFHVTALEIPRAGGKLRLKDHHAQKPPEGIPWPRRSGAVSSLRATTSHPKCNSRLESQTRSSQERCTRELIRCAELERVKPGHGKQSGIPLVCGWRIKEGTIADVDFSRNSLREFNFSRCYLIKSIFPAPISVSAVFVKHL